MSARNIPDAVAERLGKALPDVLRLRRDREQLWCAAWGNKTDIGLGRTVARIVEEQSQPAAEIDADTGAPIVRPLCVVIDAPGNRSAYWLEPLPGGARFLVGAPVDGEIVQWGEACEIDPEECDPADYAEIVAALDDLARVHRRLAARFAAA